MVKGRWFCPSVSGASRQNLLEYSDEVKIFQIEILKHLYRYRIQNIWKSEPSNSSPRFDSAGFALSNDSNERPVPLDVALGVDRETGLPKSDDLERGTTVNVLRHDRGGVSLMTSPSDVVCDATHTFLDSITSCDKKANLAGCDGRGI